MSKIAFLAKTVISVEISETSEIIPVGNTKPDIRCQFERGCTSKSYLTIPPPAYFEK